MKLLVPILDDRHLATACGLVQLLTHRLISDDIDEFQDAACVRDDRLRVGIPTEQLITGFDGLPFLDL